VTGPPSAQIAVPNRSSGWLATPARQDTTHMEDTMKIRPTIAAIGAVAAMGITGAVVLPGAASAHATTHTLRFTAVQEAAVQYSSTAGGSEDKDLNKAGKVIGFDVVRFVFNPQANSTSIDVAFINSGGFLYGALHQSGSSRVSHGTVTGGTGVYTGATGTITATFNKAGDKLAVTITYSI
jgi:hypothetical protein